MMEVTYHRRRLRMTAVGHAGYAPAGQDIVCAAATMLMHTLGANVRHLHRGNSRRCYAVRVRLHPGFAWVEVQPRYDGRIVATILFDTVANGFRVLAKSYPKHVSFTQVE